MIEPSVVEGVSWRLASSLARRHPNLEIRREHPGGGQYDVLALRSGQGCSIMLNRAGTVQVHGRDDSVVPCWKALDWHDVIRRDLRDTVISLEQAAGLPPIAKAPGSTPRILVYRTLSALASLGLLTEPPDIRMGYIDTSGCGGGPANWIDDFSEIRRRTVVGDSSKSGEPRYNYWFASTRSVRVAFETTSSDTWSVTGRCLNLSSTYDSLGRNMSRLLAVVLNLGVER